MATYQPRALTDYLAGRSTRCVRDAQDRTSSRRRWGCPGCVQSGFVERRREQCSRCETAVRPPFSPISRTSCWLGNWPSASARWTAFRSATSPSNTTSSRWSAMSSAPRAVHGPIPQRAVNDAMKSSSGSVLNVFTSSRPSKSISARSRSVPIFRHERPAWRNLFGVDGEQIGWRGEMSAEKHLDAVQGPSSRLRQRTSGDR